MTQDTRQITADNLRADFMNATTTWQRWQVLNRALEWAVVASENAEHYRQWLTEMKARAETAEQRHRVRHGERVVSDGPRTIRAGDVVSWDGDEEGWVVRHVGADGLVQIVPLAENWTLYAMYVKPEDLMRTKVTPEMFGAVPEPVTDHDPEPWAEGAYDQLFEHYDVGKS